MFTEGNPAPRVPLQGFWVLAGCLGLAIFRCPGPRACERHILRAPEPKLATTAGPCIEEGPTFSAVVVDNKTESATISIFAGLLAVLYLNGGKTVSYAAGHGRLLPMSVATRLGRMRKDRRPDGIRPPFLPPFESSLPPFSPPFWGKLFGDGTRIAEITHPDKRLQYKDF